MQPTYLGNIDLLKCKKVAYFCSRNYSAECVLWSYDWATNLAHDICVVSTFRSPIEKDVLHFLLKRHQPVIMVLGKRMYRQVPSNLQEAIQANRMLIVSNFPETQLRPGNETYEQANHDVLSMVTEVTFGCIALGSSLQQVYAQAKQLTQIEKLTIL